MALNLLALRYNNVLPKVSGKVKHNITNENPEMIHMNQKVHLQLALTVKIEPKNGPKLGPQTAPKLQAANPTGKFQNLTTSATLAPPVAKQGLAKNPPKNLNIHKPAILLTKAVGICSMTNKNNVMIYMDVRPNIAFSDIGLKTNGPTP